VEDGSGEVGGLGEVGTDEAAGGHAEVREPDGWAVGGGVLGGEPGDAGAGEVVKFDAADREGERGSADVEAVGSDVSWRRSDPISGGE
jgi:hypothetical protein